MILVNVITNILAAINLGEEITPYKFIGQNDLSNINLNSFCFIIRERTQFFLRIPHAPNP